MLAARPDPGFGFWANVERMNRWGDVWEGVTPTGRAVSPSQEKNSFWGLESRNAYFGAFSAPFECLLLHCNTSRSRRPVRLPTLIFQADCGLLKDAGASAEEDTEHLP